MKSNRNLTLMVSWISFFYLFGTGPYLVFYILRNGIEFTPILTLVSDISQCFIQLSHGVNIFIYYHFNKMFRMTLFAIFINLRKFASSFFSNKSS